MKQFWCLAGMLLVSYVSNGIVVRHDVPDSQYVANAADYPMIAYLPGEGQGILISNQWVVTAAHAVLWRPVHSVVLNGITQPVAKVIVHPGYKAVPKDLKSGDAAPLMNFMASSDDIALIKLKHPVAGITPAENYKDDDEQGQIAKIVAAGATGNGLLGEYPHSPHRSKLRHAFSRVISADDRWLGLKFVAPPNALPLEGMPADGDSGAPVFIKVNGRWQLAGLVSRKLATGKISDFTCCRYGQVTYQTRVSRYAAWIDKTIRCN